MPHIGPGRQQFRVWSTLSRHVIQVLHRRELTVESLLAINIVAILIERDLIVLPLLSIGQQQLTGGAAGIDSL
jgi:hypothetical protein